jgi:hypothetical protein
MSAIFSVYFPSLTSLTVDLEIKKNETNRLTPPSFLSANKFLFLNEFRFSWYEFIQELDFTVVLLYITESFIETSPRSTYPQVGNNSDTLRFDN